MVASEVVFLNLERTSPVWRRCWRIERIFETFRNAKVTSVSPQSQTRGLFLKSSSLNSARSSGHWSTPQLSAFMSWFESTSPVLSCCSCCAQKSRPINWDGNYTHGEDSGHIRTSNPIKSLKLTNIYQYLTNTYQYHNILPILTNILPICINMSSIFKSKYVLKYSTKTPISEFPRSHLASGSSRIQYSDLRILGVWVFTVISPWFFSALSHSQNWSKLQIENIWTYSQSRIKSNIE